MLVYVLLLQSLSAELRARKLEVDDLKSQIEAKDDALAAAGAETHQMHKVNCSNETCQLKGVWADSKQHWLACQPGHVCSFRPEISCLWASADGYTEGSGLL